MCGSPCGAVRTSAGSPRTHLTAGAESSARGAGRRRHARQSLHATAVVSRTDSGGNVCGVRRGDRHTRSRLWAVTAVARTSVCLSSPFRVRGVRPGGWTPPAPGARKPRFPHSRIIYRYVYSCTDRDMPSPPPTKASVLLDCKVKLRGSVCHVTVGSVMSCLCMRLDFTSRQI